MYDEATLLSRAMHRVHEKETLAVKFFPVYSRRSHITHFSRQAASGQYNMAYDTLDQLYIFVEDITTIMPPR